MLNYVYPTMNGHIRMHHFHTIYLRHTLMTKAHPKNRHLCTSDNFCTYADIG